MTMKKVGRAMSWSLAARIAASGVGFVATMIITRALSTRDWGLYSEIRTIMQFVLVIVMLGVDSAILKFAPRLRLSGGSAAFSRTFRTLVAAQVVVWLAALAAVRFGGNLVSFFFHDPSGRFGFYLEIAIACFILELFVLLLSNLFQSWYETKRLAAVVIAGNALYLVLIAVTMGMKLGIAAVILSAAAMNLLIVALLVPRARGLLRTVSAAGAGPGTREVLRFSLPFVVTGLLGQIVWRQSEVLFLGRLTGAEAAGFFQLAYRLPQMLLEFVPLTVWPIVMAGMSELHAKDATALPRAVRLYYKLIFLLVVPVGAMGFAFSRALVPIVFEAKMLPAALLTQLFFVVFSYSFLYTPLSMTFYVMGKSWINMLIFLGLAILEIGLDLALIPAHGMWGALIAVSIVLLVAVAVFHIVMRRVVPEVKTPVGFIARVSIAAIPTLALAAAAARWSSPGALTAEIAAGIVLLVAGFRVMRVIGEEEKELIRALPIPAKERLLALF